ncbi:MAG: hypothetical protein FJX33_09900 [Alphaproteobacteria bacterium]|nr:hypothetical protein [Alphaproteobacteria bacterium]
MLKDAAMRKFLIALFLLSGCASVDQQGSPPAEYGMLLRAAGLGIQKVVPTGAPWCIVEAALRPVSDDALGEERQL